MEKTFEKETLKSMLSEVYQDLVSVADAPDRHDAYFDEAQEAEKYYKAIDNYGSVYLVRNPALMACQAARFETLIIREKPKKMLTHDQAKTGTHKFYASDSAFQPTQKRGVSI